MGTIASQISSLTIVYSTVIRAHTKENIKAPLHWPLCGKFTATGEFPVRMASNADNVSIWWRHHENGPLNHNLCLEHVWILEMHITLCSVRVYTKTAKCHRLFTTLNLLMRYNLTYNMIHSLSWSKKYANCMKNWRQLRSLGNWKSQKYKVIMR